MPAAPGPRLPPRSRSANARSTASSPRPAPRPPKHRHCPRGGFILSGRRSFGARRQPASLFGNEGCDFAGEVLAVISVAAEGTQVLMAGERRDGAHIAVGHLECRGDREMAQLVRANRETGLGA